MSKTMKIHELLRVRNYGVSYDVESSFEQESLDARQEMNAGRPQAWISFRPMPSHNFTVMPGALGF